MSKLREDFEAWYRAMFAENPNRPGALTEWLAYQAATERAAKLCDEQGDFYMQQAREGDQSGASDHKACAAVECADSIRGA